MIRLEVPKLKTSFQIYYSKSERFLYYKAHAPPFTFDDSFSYAIQYRLLKIMTELGIPFRKDYMANLDYDKCAIDRFIVSNKLYMLSKEEFTQKMNEFTRENEKSYIWMKSTDNYIEFLIHVLFNVIDDDYKIEVFENEELSQLIHETRSCVYVLK